MAALQLLTSDEFCLDLSRKGQGWQLFPLEWEMPNDLPTLAMHRIIAAGAEIVLPNRKRSAPSFNVPQGLDADPFEQGRSAAPPSSKLGMATAIHFSGNAGGGVELFGDTLLSEDEADMPEDGIFNEDIAEAMEAAVRIDQPLQPAEENIVGGLDEDEGAVADGGPEQDTVAEPDAATVLDQGVAACRKDVLGYVTCAMPEFQHKPILGRITTWPESRPEEKRSLSMRCMLHTNCSVAVPRWRVTDQLLFRWLLEGVYEDRPTAQRKAELRVMHRDLWNTHYKPMLP